MLLVLCGYVAATRGDGGTVVAWSNYIPKIPRNVPFAHLLIPASEL
mgnify:CR=1 FL=1